jgi:hypothetical protein
MLLHAHAVNEAREQAGKLVANSLWFCGGGVMAEAASPYAAVFSDDAFVRGLADTKPVPDSSSEFTDSTLIDLDARQGWEALEKNWFVGVLQALKTGRAQEATLHLATADKVHIFSISHRDLWKFWRKKRPLPQSIG